MPIVSVYREKPKRLYGLPMFDDRRSPVYDKRPEPGALYLSPIRLNEFVSRLGGGRRCRGLGDGSLGLLLCGLVGN